MEKINNPTDLYTQMTVDYLDYMEEKKDLRSRYLRTRINVLAPLLAELQEKIPPELRSKVESRVCFDLKKGIDEYRHMMIDIIQRCLEKENLWSDIPPVGLKRVLKRSCIFVPSLFSEREISLLSESWKPYFNIDAAGYISLAIDRDEDLGLSAEFRQVL